MTFTGSEFQLQKYVVQLLRLCARPDVIYYHCPNGEYRSPKTAARLKAMGVIPGVADICLTIKGLSCYLELKTAKGRPSAAQLAFAERARMAGGLYSTARSPEEAEATLARWGALQSVSAVSLGGSSTWVT